MTTKAMTDREDRETDRHDRLDRQGGQTDRTDRENIQRGQTDKQFAGLKRELN